MSWEPGSVTLKDGREVTVSGSQISDMVQLVLPGWNVLAQMSPDTARELAEKLVLAADYVDPEGRE
ncbi:hypothetical protein EVC24_134 [Rhizobium phage RHph_I4]|nr:hypothetical protein EVC24_134 [Rhizobium phage RHph_I4]